MNIDWAYKLKAREEAGDKICLPAKKAWREVLTKVGVDTVKPNDPKPKEEKKIKKYSL